GGGKGGPLEGEVVFSQPVEDLDDEQHRRVDPLIADGAVGGHHEIGDDPLAVGQVEAAEPVRGVTGRDRVGQDRPEAEGDPAVVAGPGAGEDVPVDQLVALAVVARHRLEIGQGG